MAHLASIAKYLQITLEFFTIRIECVHMIGDWNGNNWNTTLPPKQLHQHQRTALLPSKLSDQIVQTSTKGQQKETQKGVVGKKRDNEDYTKQNGSSVKRVKLDKDDQHLGKTIEEYKTAIRNLNQQNQLAKHKGQIPSVLCERSYGYRGDGRKQRKSGRKGKGTRRLWRTPGKVKERNGEEQGNVSADG